ncbi:MAG: phosphoenolpyruvate carboxykinase (ATP), partial [Ferruginibacter sp.]
MSITTLHPSPLAALKDLGINSNNIHYQLSPNELTEQAVQRGEGVLNNTGALVINTGEFTGRSPKDKFIVKDKITQDSVYWNDFNLPIEEKYFDKVFEDITRHLSSRELWVRDCFACADPAYRFNIRVVNEKPGNNLFAYNMFLRPTDEELENFEPDWQIFSAPGLKLDPKECGTRQHNGA